MTFGASNLTQLRMIEEDDFGVTPDTGNSNNIRNTGDTLAFSIKKTESAEIVSDRMTTDLIITGADSNGPVNFELSYKEFDTLLRAALMAAGWNVYGTQAAGVGQGVGDEFDAIFDATVLHADVAPTGTSAFSHLKKGQWFQVQAPGSANDKKIVRVSSTVAPTADTVTVDAATPFVVEATPVATKLSSARIENGASQTSFTFEREHSDIGQFFQFRGMTVSKMSLSLSSGAVITGSFEFMGKDGTRQNATIMPGSPIPSQTYDVMNAVAGVGTIYEGGVPLVGTKIKKLDLSVDNSLRAQDAIGTLGAAGIGMGSFKVSGNIEVYLADGTLYDKFLNNTPSSLQVPVMDGSKNGYVLQLPKLKYGDAKVTAGSKDQDCMLSIPFTGLKDQASGKALLIDRFGV